MKCDGCNGVGIVVRHPPNRQHSAAYTCLECKGTGVKPVKPCPPTLIRLEEKSVFVVRIAE